MADDYSDETNVPNKLLLISTQVSRICIAFANDTSANTEFLKSQLSKMIQLEGFDPFNFIINSAKSTSQIISKAQHLAIKMPDDKFN